MTTGTNKFEYSGSGPARDKRGRFQTGASGNPLGRPRVQPSGPRSIQEALRAAFSEVVAVGGAATPNRTMPLLDLVIHTMVRGATKIGPKDQVLMLERLAKMGVFDTPYEDSVDFSFSEEDRRLIEIIERDVLSCDTCGCVKGDQPHGEE